MGDFLAFRKMISPVVIQILFWIAVIGVVLTGVSIMGGTSSYSSALPVDPKIVGLIVIILGPLVVRFYCELLIVFFRMYESMRVIERNTAAGSPPPPVA
jgi:hypothetical protein